MARLETSNTGAVAGEPGDKTPPAGGDELARLRAENESLRGQLVEARAGRPDTPTRDPLARPERDGKPVLSEGERQELELSGVTRSAFGGGDLLADDYGIEVKTEEGRERLARARAQADRRGAAPAPGEK